MHTWRKMTKRRSESEQENYKDFNNCVQELGLVRLEHVGDRFTWFKGDMKERLDWAEWMSQHQERRCGI